MSVRATNWVWDQIRNGGLSPTETVLLLKIGWKHEVRQTSVKIGHEDLAEDCGVSRSSVIRAIKGLVERGLISVTRRPGSSQSRFALNFDAEAEVGDEAGLGRADAHNINVANWNEEKCYVSESNVPICDVERVNLKPTTSQSDTSNVANWNDTKTPRKTPRKTLKKDSSPAKARSVFAPYEADFGEWYREYPRKAAIPKALAAYAKARRKGVSAAELLVGMRQFRWPSDPRFYPYPASWLNAEQWKDEPSQIGSSGSKSETKVEFMQREMMSQGFAR